MLTIDKPAAHLGMQKEGGPAGEFDRATSTSVVQQWEGFAEVLTERIVLYSEIRPTYSCSVGNWR
jgi:hypothetical protein